MFNVSSSSFFYLLLLAKHHNYLEICERVPYSKL